MSVTDQDAIQALLEEWSSSLKIAQEKARTLPANNRIAKKFKERVESLTKGIDDLRSNPESKRKLINQKKSILEIERAPAVAYPNFTFEPTNGYQRLKTIDDSISNYARNVRNKKIANNIPVSERINFTKKLLLKYGIQEKNIYRHWDENDNSNSDTNAAIRKDILNYLYIKETFEPILRSLVSEFPSDYSLTVNFGSGGLMSQILPRDESYKTAVLQRYPKHLFLCFDSSEGGWHEYAALFTKEPNASNDSNPHSLRMKPIQEYLGVEGTYEKLSEKCFQYKYFPTLNGVSTEVRFVFFDSLIMQFGFLALEPLIQNASLRIATCTWSYGCQNSLYKLPYVLNHFDYYYTNNYSKNPEFTKILQHGDDVHRIVNLNSLRSKASSKLNVGILKDYGGSKDMFFFDNAKLTNKGVAFKKKGNTTFWNIIKGGKRTRRLIPKKRKRQTRKV